MRRAGRRRGVSLVELMVGMVIMTIIGAALLRTLRDTLRFTEVSERGRRARLAARGSIAVLEQDLRTLPPVGGLEAVSDTAVTVRAPYATGVLCGVSGTTLAVSLLPADSAVSAAALHTGVLWRAAEGDWRLAAGGTVHPETAAARAACDSARIVTLPAGVGSPTSPAGRIVEVRSVSLPPTTPSGTVISLTHRLRYAFAPSAAVVGTTALWRRSLDGAGTATTSREVAFPLGADARFAFYVGDRRPVATPPADLREVHGVEVRLPGIAPEPSRDGSPTAPPAVARASILFVNRID